MEYYSLKVLVFFVGLGRTKKDNLCTSDFKGKFYFRRACRVGNLKKSSSYYVKSHPLCQHYQTKPSEIPLCHGMLIYFPSYELNNPPILKFKLPFSYEANLKLFILPLLSDHDFKSFFLHELIMLSCSTHP
jgi:hypothetical protein